jgi:hypothetical protein
MPVGVWLALLMLGVVFGQSTQKNDEPGAKEIRQMWRNVTNRRAPRPPARNPRRPASNSNTSLNNQAEKNEKPEALETDAEPLYRRTSPTLPVAGQDIGITIWRLRRSVISDPRIVIQRVESKRITHPKLRSNAETTDLTPERITVDAPLFNHELIQISVEATSGNYLYVINREQYAEPETTYGTPYLVFPTMRTNRGLNRIEPGTIINFPAMTDDPPYFEVEHSSPKHVGEEITFVISPVPITALDGKTDQVELSDAQFREIAQWRAETGRIDLATGVGKTQTADESGAAKASSSEEAKRLRHNSAMPQMIFRVARERTEPCVVTIILRIAS